nr:hypothetical protein [Morganella morganii]
MKTKRTDTRASLELALKRLQADVPLTVPKGGKISIAAVAREAGVSHATIHNRYPDIAEHIRGIVKQTTSASPALQKNQHDVAFYPPLWIIHLYLHLITITMLGIAHAGKTKAAFISTAVMAGAPGVYHGTDRSGDAGR